MPNAKLIFLFSVSMGIGDNVSIVLIYKLLMYRTRANFSNPKCPNGVRKIKTVMKKFCMQLFFVYSMIIRLKSTLFANSSEALTRGPNHTVVLIEASVCC